MSYETAVIRSFHIQKRPLDRHSLSPHGRRPHATESEALTSRPMLESSVQSPNPHPTLWECLTPQLAGAGKAFDVNEEGEGNSFCSWPKPGACCILAGEEAPDVMGMTLTRFLSRTHEAALTGAGKTSLFLRWWRRCGPHRSVLFPRTRAVLRGPSQPGTTWPSASEADHVPISGEGNGMGSHGWPFSKRGQCCTWSPSFPSADQGL